jgi:hypothetical protein
MDSDDRVGSSISRNRYDEFLDESGSWVFELREYQADLNSIVPEEIPPDPNPQEAYRAAVFLEGFIEEQQSVGTWSNDTLEQFESFDSTLEIEAIARALREIASRAD